MRTTTRAESVRQGDYLVVRETPDKLLVMRVNIPLVNLRMGMVTLTGELRSNHANGRTGYISTGSRYYAPEDEVTVLRFAPGRRAQLQRENENLLRGVNDRGAEDPPSEERMDEQGRTAHDIFAEIQRGVSPVIRRSNIQGFGTQRAYHPPLVDGRSTVTEKDL